MYIKYYIAHIKQSFLTLTPATMNIIGDAGNINVPGDIWQQVVDFYTKQLGPPTSNIKGVAIWQQEAFELKFIKSSEKGFTGAQSVYVGLPYQPQGGIDLNVLPFYAGQQGTPLPYTITLHDIQPTTELFVQGKTVVKFGVIYNPPY